MRTAHKVIATIEIIVGILFLLTVASDIQIGFGAVLLFSGLLNLI